MKRGRFVSRGRWHPILKRTKEIKITLAVPSDYEADLDGKMKRSRAMRQLSGRAMEAKTTKRSSVAKKSKRRESEKNLTGDK